jgi:hypothetical protein
MFCAAKVALRHQLDILSITDGLSEDLYPELNEVLQTLFTAHGDRIAHQYGGSAAMHKEALFGDDREVMSGSGAGAGGAEGSGAGAGGGGGSNNAGGGGAGGSGGSGAGGNAGAGNNNSSASNSTPPTPNNTNSTNNSGGGAGTPSSASTPSSSSSASSAASASGAVTPKVVKDKMLSVGSGAAGMAQNALSAVQRYYSNNVTDVDKQYAMNLLLGHYMPLKGKPHIWDLDLVRAALQCWLGWVGLCWMSSHPLMYVSVCMCRRQTSQTATHSMRTHPSTSPPTNTTLPPPPPPPFNILLL